MKERLQRFMYGRYGVDDLGRFLNILTMVFLVLAILRVPFAYPVGLALLVVSYFRILSRNAYKRSQENAAYLRLRDKVARRFSPYVQRFRQRKTHRFYRCPTCKQTLRVPKGRGKISLTCPKCHAEFVKQS